jgi:hypothetical protein
MRPADTSTTYLLVAAVDALEMLNVLLKLLPMLLRSRSRSLLERNLIVVPFSAGHGAPQGQDMKQEASTGVSSSLTGW